MRCVDGMGVLETGCLAGLVKLPAARGLFRVLRDTSVQGGSSGANGSSDTCATGFGSIQETLELGPFWGSAAPSHVLQFRSVLNSVGFFMSLSSCCLTSSMETAR